MTIAQAVPPSQTITGKTGRYDYNIQIVRVPVAVEERKAWHRAVADVYDRLEDMAQAARDAKEAGNE
jgi:hypothetical protein